MRIERLDLDLFGHFRDTSLPFDASSGTVTLVVGPNEAGKSTTVRALDSLLFGFARGVKDDHGAGRGALRVGAALVGDDGRRLEVVRQGLAKRPLVDASGEPVHEGDLAALLGHIDRPLFQTLFRIGHQELTGASEALLATDGEIGRLLFGASLGAPGLRDASGSLTKRADALFKPRASNPPANRSLAAYRDLRKQARESRVRPQQWDALQERVRSLDAQLAVAKDRARRLDARAAKLARVAEVLAMLGQRTAEIEAVAGLRAAGAVGLPTWVADARRRLDEQGRLADDSAKVHARREEITRQLAELDIDDVVLTEEAEIVYLVGQLGRYRKDTSDLADLLDELRDHRGRVAGLLDRLGIPGHEDDVPMPTDAQRITIDALASSRSGLDTAVRSATEETQKVRNAAEQVRARLAAACAPPGVSLLDRLVKAAREAGPLDAELAAARAAGERHDATVAGALGRMGLDQVAPDDAASLRVPDRASVTALRESAATVANTRASLETRQQAAMSRQGGLELERDELTAADSLPDPAELGRARAHRDTGWDQVRGVLEGRADDGASAEWSGGAPLADAFESALRDADQAADTRFAHAGQLTRLERIDADLVAIGDELGRIAAERLEVDGREQATRDRWADDWSHLPIAHSTPDEIDEWLGEHARLLQLLEARAAAAEAVRQLGAQIAGHTRALTEELVAIGHAPRATATLLALVSEAADVVDAAQAAARELERESRELDGYERDLPERERLLAAARQERADWDTAWADAVAAVDLDRSVEPNAASGTLALRQELVASRATIRSLEERIEGLRVDLAGFERSARAVLGRLGIEVSAERLAAEVEAANRRLRDVIEANGTRRKLQEQSAELDVALAETEAELDAADTALRAVRDALDLGEDDDLTAVIERSDDVHGHEAERARIEELLQVAGAGKSIPELEAEAAEFDDDADVVAAERRATDEERAELERELDELRAALADARAEIHRIDGDDVAADLDQQAEEKLAETAILLDEYVRVALATAVLERVVAEFGRTHQRPLLDQASALFATLTDRAFTGLVVDHDGSSDVLLACRRTGELLATGQLSDGTRDQLYLALRLAGVAHQLDNLTESVPLVLDDVLINFDDVRAAAALRALAEVAERTQVLLFTHEADLARLGADTLGERCQVVALDGRDHGRSVLSPDG